MRATEQPARGRLEAPAAIVLLLTVVAAILLRTVTLSGESLEGDEVFSSRVASRPPAAALDTVLRDIVHPPLYYVLLKLVVAVAGDGPLALRLLSLASGTLLVVAVASLGQRLFASRVPALTAAALVAASNVQIFNSQQTRSYALYALLTVVLLIALVRALEQPGRTGRWAAYAAAAVALVLTHYVGALYIAATTPAVLLHPSRRTTAPRWLAASALAAAALVGWLALILPYYRAGQGVGANLGWMGAPSLSELAYLFATFTGVGSYRRAMSVSIGVASVFLALALAVVLAARRGTLERRAAWGVFLAGPVSVVPPLLLFVLTREPVGLTIFGERHLLPSQALWALLLSAGLLPLLRPPYRPAAAVGAVALVALQLGPSLAASGQPRRVPYAEIAQFIRTPVPSEQRVFTADWYVVGAPINYQLRPSRDTVAELPATADALPDTFWFAYRPDREPEMVRVMALQRQGWRVREGRLYAALPNGRGGTRFAR